MAREETEVEVKKLVEDVQKAFHEFKHENEKGQKASTEYLSKVEKEIADKDARHMAAIKAVEAKAQEQADKVEKLLNRVLAQTTNSGDDKKKAAEERLSAFDTVMRKGVEGLGHAEVSKLVEAKTLLKSDDTAGGYLAPPEYIADIIKAAVLVSPMRDLVTVRKTGRKSIQIPKRTTTAAAVWVAEQATRAETTNPAFGLVEVPTHEMTAECYISFEELEDSIFDLEQFITDEFSEQFGVSEGAAVVSGNGVGKPFGLTDAGQAVATTGTGGATIASASGAKGDAIITLFHAVKTPYAMRGSWILNRSSLGAVRKLVDSQSRYLWEPSPAPGNPSTILGAPYTEVPDMPSEGSNNLPIGFGDWKRAYVLVDRLSMAMLRDPYSKAGVGAVKFVGRRRVGGQVQLAEAVRFLKCA